MNNCYLEKKKQILHFIIASLHLEQNPEILPCVSRNISKQSVSVGISSCSELNLQFWYQTGLLHCGISWVSDFYYKSKFTFEFATTLLDSNNMHVKNLN